MNSVRNHFQNHSFGVILEKMNLANLIMKRKEERKIMKRSRYLERRRIMRLAGNLKILRTKESANFARKNSAYQQF